MLVFVGWVERVLVLFVYLLHILPTIVLFIIRLLVMSVDTCDEESVTVVLNVFDIVLRVITILMSLWLRRVFVLSRQIGVSVECLKVVNINRVLLLSPRVRNV